MNEAFGAKLLDMFNGYAHKEYKEKP